MQSHISKVHTCLAVTCHQHFWQNDWDLLCATAVTREWNRCRNKSQHRKLTLEKKKSPAARSRDSNSKSAGLSADKRSYILLSLEATVGQPGLISWERERDRQTDRQTDRHRERHRETETQKDTDRQTQKESKRETETEKRLIKEEQEISLNV